MTTAKGRVGFILNRLGDYTITADAVGYRPGQREISIPVAVEAEEEIVLQRDSAQDRKSTRLNSSHLVISYAVFCLKKKKNKKIKKILPIQSVNYATLNISSTTN